MSDSNSDVRIFIANRDLTPKGPLGTSDDKRGTLTVTDAGVAKSDSNIDQFAHESADALLWPTIYPIRAD